MRNLAVVAVVCGLNILFAGCGRPKDVQVPILDISSMKRANSYLVYINAEPVLYCIPPSVSSWFGFPLAERNEVFWEPIEAACGIVEMPSFAIRMRGEPSGREVTVREGKAIFDIRDCGEIGEFDAIPSRWREEDMASIGASICAAFESGEPSRLNELFRSGDPAGLYPAWLWEEDAERRVDAVSLDEIEVRRGKCFAVVFARPTMQIPEQCGRALVSVKLREREFSQGSITLYANRKGQLCVFTIDSAVIKASAPLILNERKEERERWYEPGT